MKFRKVNAAPIPKTPGIGAARGRPDWLREWLANKPHYVVLTCGHKEDLTYGHLLIIAVFGKGKHRTVMCERCNVWVDVVRGITAHEYYELPPPQRMDEPMF